MSRTYAASILMVFVAFTSVLIESEPHATTKTEPKKEKAHSDQHEESQNTIRNSYYHKPGGSFFFTNVGPNSFEYRGMFQPGESPVNFISNFTSFFNDFPEFSKLSSFEDLFSRKKQLSPTTPISPKRTPSQYKFNPSLPTIRPRVMTNDVLRFPNSNVRYLKNSPILKVNIHEYKNNRKSMQKFNKSSYQESKKFRKELQRQGPQSPYNLPEEPTYKIQRNKTTTPPPSLYNFEILKSKALYAARPLPDNALRRKGFFPKSTSEVYFPNYDILRGKARVKKYPKIFKFNDYRVNIVEFDREKKNGKIDDLAKADALDPTNVPRKTFLILRGGVYDDDRVARRRISVNRTPFKSEQQDFYDVFADDNEFSNDDSFFYNFW
ncbi:uncharacterized protein LOC111086380 [Limulus polyphemus]|uniref:Uncharacterized protein LOC111086380 n=1 Tax=Limulus polyphemus TaxID=6850 RepID=A0ABM1SM30_LIMPO|nr:uncharacterized protein LOC111086380 [Limulus polyphemus]